MAVPDSAAGPTTRQIAIASAIALAIATVTLVTVILPAEYSTDPLGTGRALGLVREDAPETVTLPALPSAKLAYVPRKAGAASLYQAAYKAETTEFVLGPYEYIEYKYQMENGASMVFSWSASAAVDHEFHGEPDVDPEKGVVSYDKGIAQSGNGDLLAPFKGIHGWYWENRDGEPVTIRLTSSGFYESGLEMRSDKSRKVHELKPVAVAPVNDRSKP